MSIPEENISTQFANSVERDLVVIKTQVEQSQRLVADAVSELYSSFERLNADTNGQNRQLEDLLNNVTGNTQTDEGEIPISMAEFVSKTADVLEYFSSQIINFSKQSVLIALKIDDMSTYMDTIFELVSKVDAIAEDTSILAINASLEAARAGETGKGFDVVASEVRGLSRDARSLNEEIAIRIDQARQAVTDVKNAITTMASQDMNFAIEAKSNVSSMLTQINDMNQRVTHTLEQLELFSKSIQTGASNAVRCLQFDDLVTQLLAQVLTHVDTLEKKVSHIPDLFDSQASPNEDLTSILGETSSVDTSPVSQLNMDAGDVELF